MPVRLLSRHLPLAMRVATGASMVEKAVNEFALHALASRDLTAENMIAVVRSVGEGIESCEAPVLVPLCEAQRGAWAGLSSALCQALHAFELAAVDRRHWGWHVGTEERRRLLAEFESMERSLAAGSAADRLDTRCRERLASVLAVLRRPDEVPAAEPGAPASSDRDPDSLALTATAILIGLTTDIREPRFS